MIVIPATISNNVPGTDFSLGADTSLNAIADVGFLSVSLPSVSSGALSVVGGVTSLHMEGMVR